MPRPSDQSYQDFVRAAFSYLVNPGPVPPDAGLAVSELYDCYADYDPDPTVRAKRALTGNRLYGALVDFITNVGGRIIRVQNDDWSVLDQPAALVQYRNPPLGGIRALPTQARKALTSYLHVYPTGTQRVALDSNKLIRPANRPTTNNWRIGINVKPRYIARAAQALVGIMDANRHIDHIKFSAPGSARKPDSVIIYMRKRTATYGTIKAAVQTAIPVRYVQPKFSPMWNEFADGFAEAAEAPIHGGSFGTFRCILAYLAYPRRASTAASLSLSDYQKRADETFELFGIPLFEPHKQGRLYRPPFNDPIRKRFMRAYALHKGKAANRYRNRQLIDR